MRRTPILLAILALAAGLLWLAMRTPVPPETPGGFSTRRALQDVSVIARTPHVLGSSANQAVRGYLLRRLSALGVQTSVQTADVWEREALEPPFVSMGRVNNIVGLLPGRRPDLPALVMMAHYDSVAGSAGAGDDATGVACLLEVVRLIGERGFPERDVVIVFTEGEEEGMLGARAFFRLHPLARRAGFVLNLDTRGSSGRTMMYEMGPDPGGSLDLYHRAVTSPRAFSIFPFVYRQLPYGTDFTLARRTGLQGLNLGFVGAEFTYHTPAATLARLDPGAVADMGRQSLAIARAVAFSPTLPRAGPEPVYGDVLGLVLIVYPPWAGWLLLTAAAALIALALRRRSRPDGLDCGALLSGAAAVFYAGSFAAVLMTFVGHAAAFPGGRQALVSRFLPFEGVILLAAAAAVAVAAAGSAAGRRWWLLGLLCLAAGAASSLFGGIDMLALGFGVIGAASALFFRRSADRSWAELGALAQLLVIAVCAQIWAPEVAPVAAWPLLVACVAYWASPEGPTELTRGWSGVALCGVAALLVAIILAWVALLAHLSQEAVDLPALGALAAMIVLPLLWPWLPQTPTGIALRPGAGLTALSLAGSLALAITNPWSAVAPRPVSLLYVTDGVHAWRASQRPRDDWTRAALAPHGEAISSRQLPTIGRAAVSDAGAPDASLGQPQTTVRYAPGRVHIDLQPPPGVDYLFLDLRVTAPVSDVHLQGAPVRLLGRVGEDSHIVWIVHPGAISLDLAHQGHGALIIHAAAFRPSWPAALPPPPPLPADRMAMGRSGSSVRLSTSRVEW
jgi:hypothetical protein